ncbi:MAG: hypothetical protein LBG48_00230 [Rickettsiales bacterium]|nr:hypothetical protein [Rickettsiales bacterium]
MKLTKLCDTIIELRWFVFPSIVIIVIMLGIGFVWWCKYRIVKLKIKDL